MHRFQEYRNQFTLQNDLKLRMPTEWGSLSFVDAIIKSIETILALGDGIEILHLVSGYDIPVKNPVELFTDKIIGFSNGYSAYRRADQSAMRALSFGFEGKFLKGVKVDGRTAVILRNHFVEHSSWFSLSRAHCMILVNSTRTLKFLRPIAEKLREANECYPDEWLIGTTLHRELQGPANELPSSIVDIENTAVIYPVQYGSALFKAQRPIVWTSLNRCARTIKLGKRKRRAVLSDVLNFYMGTDSLFFRKIGRIEELPEFYIRQLERYTNIDCHEPCEDDQETGNREEKLVEEGAFYRNFLISKVQTIVTVTLFSDFQLHTMKENPLSKLLFFLISQSLPFSGNFIYRWRSIYA